MELTDLFSSVLTDSEKRSSQLYIPKTGNSLLPQIHAPNQGPWSRWNNPIFFQTYWDIVKTDLIRVVQLYFESGHLSEGALTILLVP